MLCGEIIFFLMLLEFGESKMACHIISVISTVVQIAIYMCIIHIHTHTNTHIC